MVPGSGFIMSCISSVKIACSIMRLAVFSSRTGTKKFENLKFFIFFWRCSLTPNDQISFKWFNAKEIFSYSN